MQRTGFTLIEALVVVAIISFLVWLLFSGIHSSPRNHALWRSVANGDLAECKKIIDEGTIKSERYPIYLRMAVSFQYLDIIRYFVEDLKTPLDDKELFIYAVWGDLDKNKEGTGRKIIDYLLEKGVPVDATVATELEKWTLLHAATLNGYVDICKMAIEKGADVEAVNNNRQTPLQMAAEQGHAEVFHLLLDSGAKLDVKTKGGYKEKTLLHFAAAGGNGEICKFLLNHGADPNAKDNEGAQPINDAAKAKSTDAYNVLKEAEERTLKTE